MKIEPFHVEIWMNEWETRCAYNLAETCVDSITVAALLDMTGTDLSDLPPMKLTYGAITGSDRLRHAIAQLYDSVGPDAITVTHGTIAANMLVHKALINPGDRVIAVVPTYQQHYAIPASLGADIQKLVLREQDQFLPDLDKLRDLVTPGTKLIALTNPNNPTGALIDRPMLEDIAAIARAAGAYILCDEVYRGTGQTGDGMSTSIADIYEKGISTGGMSKTYSLAGLRVGWIAAPKNVTDKVMIHRDYDTISVGMINDHLASLALEHKDKILARSHAITRGNLALLDAWMQDQTHLSWVKPKAGTTAMLRCNLPVTSRALCVGLLQKTGVMFTPGDAFEMDDYIRIGFANNPDVMKKGLSLVSDYLVAYSTAG